MGNKPGQYRQKRQQQLEYCQLIIFNWALFFGFLTSLNHDRDMGWGNK